MDELLYKCALKVAYSLFKSRSYIKLVYDLYDNAEHAARVACVFLSDLPSKFNRLDGQDEKAEARARVTFYCVVIRRFFFRDISRYNNYDLRVSARKGTFLEPRAGKLVTLSEADNNKKGIKAIPAKLEAVDVVADCNAFIAKVRALDLNEQQRETLELLLEGYDIASIEKKLNLGRSVAYQRAKSLIKRVRLYLAPEVPEDAPFNAIGSRKHKKS